MARPVARATAARVVDSARERGTDGAGVVGEGAEEESRREGQAAAGEAVAEAITGAREAPLDGAEGPAEAIGGLLVGQAFEVAEGDRGAVRLGQAGQLLVDRAGKLGVVEGDLRGRGRVQGRDVGRLAIAESSRLAVGTDGHAKGDAVEPGAE